MIPFVPLPAPPARVILFILLITAAAFLIRLEGIERHGMSHVEVYAPGIELPPEISEPPPRLTLGETLWWHFHDEPHPQGYYLGMLFWTRLFGTGLTALRMPSVLAGTGSILLVFLLVRRKAGDAPALAAAAMLALHGHQIYWSQQARMYAPGMFLGIAATLLLDVLLSSSRKRTGLEALYILTLWLGTATEDYIWPLLFTQVLWAATHPKAGRVLSCQALAAALGSPFLTHALYRSRILTLKTTPGLTFLSQWLGFGFLFETDHSSDPARIPSVLTLGAAVILTGIALAFFLNRYREQPTESNPEPLSRRFTLLVSGSVSLVILGLAWIAHRHRPYLAATAILPIASWLIPGLTRVFSRLLSRLVALHRFGLLLWLALIPGLAVTAVSLYFPILKSRGMLVYTPYLVAACAIGIWRAGRLRVALLPIAFSLCAVSILYYRQVPDNVAYRSLASDLQERLAPGDLIFVKARDYLASPLFYHLGRTNWPRLVATDWPNAAAGHPQARVWIVEFHGDPAWPGMTAAVKNYTRAGQVNAFRARAVLYAPP